MIHKLFHYLLTRYHHYRHPVQYHHLNPKEIAQNIKIPVQGGLNPKILLTDKETLKKETIKYLEIFKDHPYIFNLGHGVLPETKPEMVEFLVNTVKDFK